jgi:hemerythrin
MKRGTIENIQSSTKIPDLSLFKTLKDLVQKIRSAGGVVTFQDLTEEERKVVEQYKEFLKSHKLEMDERGNLIIKNNDEEKIRKIRNFILRHPFMILYIPDAEMFELMEELIKKGYVERIPVTNMYGGVVYIVKPGNIKPDDEIVKKIENILNKKYMLGARLVDICSSVFVNGNEYELYFLDGSVFKCREDTFSKDKENLPFTLVGKDDEEIKEIKLAATPLAKEKMEYAEAKESYDKLIEYLKSAISEENSVVEKFESRFRLSRATSEGIFIDKENNNVYFNKILIERALTSSGRALFDKNYAKSILKNFFKFLSEFGIQEEISAGKTIYKISMEALR